MPLSADEQERQRASRLLKKQINSRDPGPSKIRGYDWGKAAERGKVIKKNNQKPLLVELFDVFPARWKGVMIGLLLAIIPTIVITMMTQDIWRVMALLPPLVFGIGGFVVGSMMQEKMD